MIIATIVPNNYFAPWDFVKSVLQLPPKYEYYAKQSAVIYENRNRVWDYFMSRNEDMLMVDSDMVFKPEDVAKIEEHLKKFDIVTGVYVLANGKPAVYPEVPDKLLGVKSCGMGFIGVSKRVTICEEPFNPLKYKDRLLGEDISFCKMANLSGYTIICDPTISVGHAKVGISYV